MSAHRRTTLTDGLICLATLYIERRRKVRRADFAVALLRKEAAALRRAKDQPTARYFESMADVIERTP